MIRTYNLTKETAGKILEDLLKRSPNHYTEYESSVNAIISEVREKGDEAVFAFTEKFDGAKLTKDTVEVTEDEINEAYALVDEKLLTVMRKAKENIRTYHEKQRQYSWFDSTEKLKDALKRYEEAPDAYSCLLQVNIAIVSYIVQPPDTLRFSQYR